jgi:hypothetical protein
MDGLADRGLGLTAELIRIESVLRARAAPMWTRWIFATTAICLAFTPLASSAEILHRVSCSMVRLYVAKYSAPTAEAWARSKGDRC